MMSQYKMWKKVGLLALALALIIVSVVGCSQPKASLVGMWKSDRDGKVIEFKEDGRYVGMKTTNYYYEVIEDKQIKLINKDYPEGEDTMTLNYKFKDVDTLVTESEGFEINWKRVKK